MSKYREVRKELAERLGSGDGPLLLPCLRCREPTLGMTLSLCGGWCRTCEEWRRRQPIDCSPTPAATERNCAQGTPKAADTSGAGQP